MNRQYLRNIADIQTGPFGIQLHKEDYVNDGTPIVTVEHLGNRVFTKQNLPKVSDEDKVRLAKYVLSKGDIVFSRVGSVDRCSYVDEVHDGWMFSGRCLRVRPTGVIDPLFLYYFFCLEKTKQFVRNIAVGATMPSINTKLLGEVEIVYPVLDVQRKIVKTLSAIDDKIENNQKINDNLEQQAQAIFKSWFIDYEPFNGKIPSTWKEYRLADFFPVVTGKKNANVSSDSGQYPFFSCSQNIAWTDNYSFEGNAILVAGNGDFNVKWYNGKFEAYQRTYVLIPYNPRYSSWLYYAVKYNLAKITSAARGSVIRFITKANLENFSFLAPRELDKYEIIDTFSTINHAIEQRVQENYRLQVFRDNLLPRLMTGEIDVSSVKI